MKFGTDGVRGPAGVFPIDAAGAARMGRAVAQLADRVLVARDSRVSGALLTVALVDAARIAGAHVQDLGLLPTSALSALLAEGWGDLGVMLTASHNGPADNGMKVLGATGGKLTDSEQEELERLLTREVEVEGALHAVEDRSLPAEGAYVKALLRASKLQGELVGASIVVDAANGAASHTLPMIFEALGADVHEVACAADGAQINVGCGALKPAALVARVKEVGADAGVAVDGDGDRCTLVSASGRVLDGDALLYLLATDRGTDTHESSVVGTVMTNAGLEAALHARGIGLVRTPVGDRHVEAALHRENLRVGAEPSGHVCLSDGLPTADGALTALRVLRGGLDIDTRLAGYEPFPSTLINVRVTDKPAIESVPALVAARDVAVAALAPQGRIVFRYSGTEPLLRVMAEGPHAALVTEVAQRLAERVEAVLGVGSDDAS